MTYYYGEGEQVEFKGPEPLGADDLRILQGLVALGGPKGIILTPEPTKETAKQLRLFLEPKWEAVEQNALVVRGSYRQLAREIGYADEGGKVFRLIRAGLERLWTVSVIVQSGKRRMGFRLLSEYASDGASDKLFVALNPRIAEAILGRRPHTRVEMSEVRALKTDPARLIHQRLCGWIDAGKFGKVSLNTLCSYVWPDTATPPTVRQRRRTTRSALDELQTLGWTVQEYAVGKYEVGRPAPRTNAHAPPY